MGGGRLAQAVFALRVGVSQNVVGCYEGGRNRPRADTLDRIANLGDSVDWLLHGDRREHAAAGDDRQWKAAVEALRELWQEPGRRPVVLRLLRGLASLTSGRR